MSAYRLTPIDPKDIPATKGFRKVSLYNEVVKEFLDSGQLAVEIPWQTIWPDSSVKRVAAGFNTFRCDPARLGLKTGWRVSRRGDRLFLLRKETDA